MNDSTITLRPGLLDEPALLEAARTAAGGTWLLTDTNVQALLPPTWADLPRHVITPGEQSKSWAVLEELLLSLDAAGLDRDGLLLALGGGVVTDLGGLAASLHRRGIPWWAVPTSLVGQVDAAVGGKTAVNLGGGKNTVGTVHLPERVLIDPRALATLPRRQLLSGLAEVLKTALISGPAATERVLALEPDDVASARPEAVAVIADCVATKRRLVAGDLHDRGPRRLLNLGHTFGHALEALALGERTHGEAVALGLLCAARLAQAGEWEATLRTTLQRWGLPTRAEAPVETLLAEMGRDKKRRGGALTVVLLPAPGQVALREGLPEAEVRRALGAILEVQPGD